MFQTQGFEPAEVAFHYLSDESKASYGKVSYVKIVEASGQIHYSVLFGKARVAPLKIITIPRLELFVLTMRQGQFLRRELEQPDVGEVFQCDSQVVLGYVNNKARHFHVLIANRSR